MKNLFLVFFLVSCASKPDTKFKKLIQQNKCEEAALNMPNFKLQSNTAHLASYPGKGLSYILSGAAYGFDVVYFVSAGIIIPVAICSPLVTHAHDPAVAANCVGRVYKFTHGKKKSLGNEFYSDTADIRCPDFNFAVNDILKVAECYEKTDQKSKALHQLINLKDPEALGGCIDETHIKDIEKRIQALEIKG